MQRHHPARQHVMVNDKLRTLAAMKQAMQDRLITVFARHGHCALDATLMAAYSAADLRMRTHRGPAGY